MQQVTEAVVDIMALEGYKCYAYIDDLAAAHASKKEAEDAFERCTEVLLELGLVESVNKQIRPSTSAIWLGVQFNTVSMRMEIPQRKIQELTQLARDWLDQVTCSKSQLRSFLGKVFHVATCSSTLRLFSNRILSTL